MYIFIDGLTNGNHLVHSALDDLERSQRQFLSPNKSTLVIHSVQRVSWTQSVFECDLYWICLPFFFSNPRLG